MQDLESILDEGAKGARLLGHSLRKCAAWECQGDVYITSPRNLLCAHPVIQRGKESKRAKAWVWNAWQSYENLGRMRRNLGDNCGTSMVCGSILSCTGTSHKQDCFMHTLLTLQAPSGSFSPWLSLKVLWYLLDPAEQEGSDCPSPCLSSAYGRSQQLCLVLHIPLFDLISFDFKTSEKQQVLPYDCTPKTTKKGKESVLGESNGSGFLKHLAGNFEDSKWSWFKERWFSAGCRPLWLYKGY